MTTLVTVGGRLRLATFKDYNPDQPRDETGKWTSEGGGSGASDKPAPNLVPQRWEGVSPDGEPVAYPFQPGTPAKLKMLDGESTETVQRVLAKMPDIDKDDHPFDKGQVESMESYRNGMYSTTNWMLRDPEGFAESEYGYRADKLESRVYDMDRAFDHSELPEDVTVYRGMVMDPDDLFVSEGAGNRPGEILSDKAFLSTTLNSAVAGEFSMEGGMMLMIHAPAGTPAIYAGSRLKEQEIIFPRDTPIEIVEIHPPSEEVPYTILEGRIVPK